MRVVVGHASCTQVYNIALCETKHVQVSRVLDQRVHGVLSTAAAALRRRLRSFRHVNSV